MFVHTFLSNIVPSISISFISINELEIFAPRNMVRHLENDHLPSNLCSNSANVTIFPRIFSHLKSADSIALVHKLNSHITGFIKYFYKIHRRKGCDIYNLLLVEISKMTISKCESQVFNLNFICFDYKMLARIRKLKTNF